MTVPCLCQYLKRIDNLLSFRTVTEIKLLVKLDEDSLINLMHLDWKAPQSEAETLPHLQEKALKKSMIHEHF